MHEGAFYMQKWFILHPECTRVHFTCNSKAQMHPECTRVHFTCKSKAQMHPECTRVHFTCKNYLICTQNARECSLHAKVRHKCTQNARGCILHAKVRHKMHARCTHFDNIYFCKGNKVVQVASTIARMNSRGARLNRIRAVCGRQLASSLSSLLNLFMRLLIV